MTPIDRSHLPTDPAVLQQLVLGLLDERDAQARQVARLQHWLTKLLRARYGPQRERVDEHQLFLFAAAAMAAHRDGPPPDASAGLKRPPCGGSVAPPTYSVLSADLRIW